MSSARMPPGDAATTARGGRALLLVRPELRTKPRGRRRRRGRAARAQRIRGRAPRDRGLRLVGEVFEVLPERELIAADLRAALPLGEFRRLVEEVAQAAQRGVGEGEVAAVDEQQLLPARRERREQRREGDPPTVDLDR
jgi:hypothetical protein